MLTRILIAIAVLTTAAYADFDRQIHVSAQPDLYVSTGSGRVKVIPGEGNEIHVKAHVYAGWNAGGDIQDRIRQISANPPIQVSGNTIRIGDTTPQERNLYNNITIDYDITAPRGVALNLRTGSGDLEVDNLSRFLKADTGSGSVRAHGIAGSADLHTGSGDIELQQAASGEVRATTGSGSVRINGLSGSLTARTGSGDIEANGNLTGPAHLQSGSGSIRLHLGLNAHYTVDASTGSGSIRVPGNRNSDQHNVRVPVNGGVILEARTGSGDIEVN